MNEPTITITGNLTADPELRFTKSGAPYVNFTVASTPRTFDRNTNEWRDGETLFLNCSAWRETAENITDSLRKGTRVIVQGRLTSRSYETQNGERRTINEIQVEEIGPSLRNAQAKITRTTQQNTWTQTPQPTTHNTENTQQTWPHPHTTPTNQPAPF